MALVLALALLLLLFFLLGFSTHALWIIAVVLFVALVAILLTRGSRGRWY